MKKEEKIKEAYGEYWEQLKPFIDCEGWMHRIDFPTKHNIDIEEHSNQYHIRPKSLQGIENNNGWIKIENEEDLPKETDLYWAIDEEFGADICEFHSLSKKWYCDDVEYYVSHYQPIEKPKPPLY